MLACALRQVLPLGDAVKLGRAFQNRALDPFQREINREAQTNRPSAIDDYL